MTSILDWCGRSQRSAPRLDRSTRILVYVTILLYFRYGAALVSLQVLVLTMASFLSGIVPPVGVSPLELLGFEETVTSEFLIGTWRCSDDFIRWDVTDVKDTRSSRRRSICGMILRSDGTMEMVNLFRPEQGRWKLSTEGLLIQDPAHPGRGWQAIPVRKRGEDGIWLFLPFSGGATGVGMERVDEQRVYEENQRSEERTFRKGRIHPRGTQFRRVRRRAREVEASRHLESHNESRSTPAPTKHQSP